MPVSPTDDERELLVDRLAALNADQMKKLQRGDLIFWKGHVAIVRDGASMLHANAFHMAVAIEPIGEAIARIAAAGSEVTSVKRL